MDFFIDDNDNLKIGNIVVLATVIVIFLCICGTLGNYFNVLGAWINKPAEIVNPNNVQNEFGWFYGQQNTLRALQADIANAQTEANTFVTTHPGGIDTWTANERNQYQQLTDRVNGYKVAYNGACSDYQARWDNIFHNLVAPRDIPRDCALEQPK